jgi:hypothetical protein
MGAGIKFFPHLSGDLLHGWVIHQALDCISNLMEGYLLASWVIPHVLLCTFYLLAKALKGLS